jgi:hypothetical protein
VAACLWCLPLVWRPAFGHFPWLLLVLSTAVRGGSSSKSSCDVRKAGSVRVCICTTLLASTSELRQGGCLQAHARTRTCICLHPVALFSFNTLSCTADIDGVSARQVYLCIAEAEHTRTHTHTHQVEKYTNPWLHLKFQYGNAKGKAFTEEEVCWYVRTVVNTPV